MTNHIALAVSGGGYRATLYSLGSLLRLNEFGLLPQLKTVTSVSGGSITTAWLACQWHHLTFDERGIATNLMAVIAEPLMDFCKKGIDIRAGIGGLLSFRESIGDKVARAYDKRLYKGARLSTLGDDLPEFVFYGTNYQTGSGFQITKARLHDYKIGSYPSPDISLAKTVAISSAFPPLLSPVHLDLDPDQWIKGPFAEYFDVRELKKRVVLTDGGLYDNMGLERVWKGSGEFSHVLVCDAGAPLSITSKIKTNWAGQLLRMTDIMTEQQRALRKRELIARFIEKDDQGNPRYYRGTYFGISTQINHYELGDAMTTDSESSGKLKAIRTRLNPFSDREQGELINWGYALADSAIRRHVKDLPAPELLVPGQWPCPEYAL